MTHPPSDTARRFLSGFAMALALASATAAQTPPRPEATPPPVASAAADDPDLLGLLQILNEETAVATKTRMNGDYVPGIVTVLHGDEMAALGARTVWDALSLVPGIEAVRDPSGIPSVTVRGLQFPFSSGNVKVLVDSMPAVRDNAGINTIVLDIPIQLVDRIEVIRGPGSVVYGDFAYMGLIHVITKKSGLGVYARPDEGSAFSGGAWGGGRTKGGLEYSFSGSAFSGGPTEVPRRRDVDDTRAFAFGSLRYRGFSLSADLTTRQIKDPVGPPPLVQAQQTHSVIEARYERDLSGATRLQVRLNDRRHRFRGFTGDLDGGAREAGVGLVWTGAARHSWLFDASVTRSAIDDAFFPTPTNQVIRPGAPLPPLPFSIHNQNLNLLSAMAQDTIEASSRVALTAGGRIDRYGDVDTRVTPRASLVFRASDRNILKLQYAEGFRAPSFFELYSRGYRDTDLGFEVNRTTEVNYVHRRPSTVVRLTAYNSRLDDLVYPSGVNAQRQTVYGNSRRATVYGGEAELEREVSRRLKVTGNVSWFKTKDSRNRQNDFSEGSAVPKYMANLVVIAAPWSRTRLTARWHYVGNRRADNLPAYHEYEATLTQKGIVAPGLDLRVGLRLSKNAGVVYPQVMPNVLLDLPYKFPRAFVELSWSR